MIKNNLFFEQIFMFICARIRQCPMSSVNNGLDINKLWDAAGNHIFDDHPTFWGITEHEGHVLRAWFQTNEKDAEAIKYLEKLNDDSIDFYYEKVRSGNDSKFNWD